MKVFIVGDIVGRPGRKTLQSYLEQYKKDYDFIVVNGENAAAGFGITEKIAVEFFSWGVDVITTGNHIWDKKEIYPVLEKTPRLLKPYNYPKGTPGRGYVIVEAKNGKKIAVLSLQGRVFMPSIDCPFQRAKEALQEIQKETNCIIVDFHAEASSEKIALAYYLDGEISSLHGTHTHIQTADERILEKGTAYITDIGMTGSENGVIGMDKEAIIAKFLTGLPQRFEIAEGQECLRGVRVEIEEETGKAKSIERVVWRADERN